MLGVPALAGDSAEQMTGLFIQSCIRFAGDANALRGWAKTNALAQLPEPVRQLFMHDTSGVAFDASNQVGKFVLTSDDSGGCSVFADQVNAAAMLASLENNMRRAGLLLTYRRDVPESPLQRRDYTTSLGGTPWRIVVGTVRDQQGGQAMLSSVRD